ncbi:unnamed protein product [Somion occarium]|uniref:Uncharacterized protein n=1 Tax=Somion occarium TaxID=3059160 RepID=A0ABP1DWL9_9APHY
MKDAYSEPKLDEAAYNFTSEYSVTINCPISEVFPILGHGDKMKEVVLLYDRCPEFKYLNTDSVPRPTWEPTPPANFAREAPSVPSDGVQPTISRQFFTLYEEVHILPGVVKRVEINGAQVWDVDAKIALYESTTALGVTVWKFKKFEEFEEDGKRRTRVSERILGKCSRWVRFIVQSETQRGHRAQMDRYHVLFS